MTPNRCIFDCVGGTDRVRKTFDGSGFEGTTSPFDNCRGNGQQYVRPDLSLRVAFGAHRHGQLTGALELVVVRPFAEKDRPGLEAIYRDSRADAAWLPAILREHSDFSHATEGEVILVAVDDNEVPEGFVSVWEPDRYIHHLYVRRGDRRKGIGTALLAALALPKPWRLKCLRANSEAAAFYRSQGWIEVSSGVGDEGPFALLENA
jgi:GNAT superfamily N-acetyltransferase